MLSSTATQAGSAGATASPAQVLRFDDTDGPEIGSKIRLGEISVWYRKVTFGAPTRAPRVHHDEPLLGIIITDCQDRVPAQDCLSLARHRDCPGFRNGRGLEAIIDSESKDKRKPRRQAPFHLGQVLGYAAVRECLVF